MVGVFHLVASLLILLLLMIFVGANIGIGALLGWKTFRFWFTPGG